jgi:hypothetical protein
LITAEETGKRSPVTDNSVFGSGAYRRPLIRPETGEMAPGETREGRVLESQRTAKTNVRRIEIAKAGDTAHEYSDAELSYDLKNGRHVSFRDRFCGYGRREADSGRWLRASRTSMI